MRPLGVDEFAVAFQPRQLARQESIPVGYVGLWVLHGRYERRFEPGLQDLQGFWNAFLHGPPSGTSLVLVRSEEVDIRVPIPQIDTVQDLRIDVIARVTFKLQSGSEPLFLSRLMADRVRMTFPEIRDQLFYPWLSAEVPRWAKGELHAELRSLEDCWTRRVDSGLGSEVERFGLNVVRANVRVFPR